jgi:hypothetical protein
MVCLHATISALIVHSCLARLQPPHLQLLIVQTLLQASIAQQLQCNLSFT